MEGLTRAAAGVVLAVVAGSATVVTGTYALLGGSQHAYAKAIVHRTNNTVSLDITESAKNGGTPIRSYGVDMTKLMHMVVIRDDFGQFMHVHPTFNRKTGVFHQTIELDAAHNYTVYADTQPKGMTQQVFRFAIGSAAPPPSETAAAPSTPSPSTVAAGPYSVALSKTTLHANAMNMLPVEITKAGKPATDLSPYLGAAGHAVFINVRTLAYIHVHPMIKGAKDNDMASMPMNDDEGMGKAGPHLMMHVPPLPAGTYKLWLQFRGGGTLYTAPFTLVAR